MAVQQPKMTKSLQRLLELFNQIEDQDTREIIASVVMTESKYRTGSGRNFPIREVRDAIDKVARNKEREKKGAMS